MLRLAVIAVFIDGDPINRVAMFVRTISISSVMLHVNALIEDLTEADRNRLHDAEEPVEQR